MASVFPPIIYRDLLIVPNDQDGDSSIVALDKMTGKIRWQVPRKGKTSFATPCVFQGANGPDQLILTNWIPGITSLDPKTGKVFWESDVFYKKHTETSIGSPIVAGDLVLGSAGWLSVNYEIIAVRAVPTSRSKPGQKVYTINRSAPLVLTPLAKDDLLFIWTDTGIVSCADVQTGKIHWRERVGGSYYGSPVWVDGRLYCVSRDGMVVVLSASKKFSLLAKNRLPEGSHATPAIAGGRMYLRTFGHLISVGGE
ncbi:MAG: hypothetical protein KatS3mg105_4775 [Gemmatales bacterium]|nr:MAG: hypothetical protein KatS3mg105_4775 [Gemmatales bacterium]